MNPFLDQFSKFISISYNPEFRCGQHIGDESITRARLGSESFAGKDMRVDFAAQPGCDRAKFRRECPQAGFADDEQIHVAPGSSGSRRRRTEDECEFNIRDSVPSPFSRAEQTATNQRNMSCKLLVCN